jgi:hypothetical protein
LRRLSGEAISIHFRLGDLEPIRDSGKATFSWWNVLDQERATLLRARIGDNQGAASFIDRSLEIGPPHKSISRFHLGEKRALAPPLKRRCQQRLREGPDQLRRTVTE